MRCIQKGENIAGQQLQPEKRQLRIWESNSPEDTKVSEVGVGGDTPGTEHDICLQPVRQPMVRQLCPCSPWRSMVGQRNTCTLWRTPCQSRWMPKGVHDSHGKSVLEKTPGIAPGSMEREAHTGAGLLACTPWEGSPLELLMGNFSPWKRFMLEQLFVEDLILWERLHTGAEEECNEAEEQRKHDDTTTVPILQSPAPLQGRKWGNGK
ncbi:hypothetical protein WISP_78886 [Willisornis vidua]|uniref:Uncharacterized protein n=1 Tax=Willisornis vidua TaxID=1566151 RepID=A0ABQ9D5H2_9PASS|nr:hypothetical protein WISP_78886 [Willisornis vidua]